MNVLTSQSINPSPSVEISEKLKMHRRIRALTWDTKTLVMFTLHLKDKKQNDFKEPKWCLMAC